MYDDIIDNINTCLSLEELGNIVKQSLAIMYSKLEADGMYCPTCFVQSVGKYEYDVDLCFVSSTGMSCEDAYWL